VLSLLKKGFESASNARMSFGKFCSHLLDVAEFL
jgi:hypothetical protein